MSVTGGEIPTDVYFHPDADPILVIWSLTWTWAESDVRSSIEVGLPDEERLGHQMERRRGWVREGEASSSRCVTQYWMRSVDSEVRRSVIAEERSGWDVDVEMKSK